MIVCKLSDLQVFVSPQVMMSGPTTYEDSLSTAATSLPMGKGFTAASNYIRYVFGRKDGPRLHKSDRFSC